MMGWLALAAAVVFNTLGNFCVKRFSTSTEINHITDYLAPSFVLGICCFGLNLLLYAKALKTIPLTIAYPIMIGVTMSGLTLFGIFAFAERFTLRDTLGLAFVAAGIALFSRIV